MAEITAAAVKALREKTDLPMMKCKEALKQAEGDEAKAIEILREEGEKVRIKRDQNETAEGQVFIAVAEDGSKAAMLEIQCESAPVATGEHLSDLGTKMVAQLLNGSGAETPEELLAQDMPEGGQTFNDVLNDILGKIREKIVVSRITTVDGPVAGYVHHDKKTGVLFVAEGDGGADEILRDVAMHVAALRPTVVTPCQLDQAAVQAERDKLTEEAKATGKPDNIIEKIVDGRMASFYNEQGVLNYQPFAKDDSKLVEKALDEKKLKAVSFTRWVIGN